MEKDIDYKCPNCKQFLMKVKSKDIATHKIKCKKCGKWIWFCVWDGYREIKDVPGRETSAGIRFY